MNLYNFLTPNKFFQLITFFLLILATNSFNIYANDMEAIRSKAKILQKQGNYKDAIDSYKKLLNEPNIYNLLIRQDIQGIFNCYSKLGDFPELDKYFKTLTKTHYQNWQALGKIAELYLKLPHWGHLINNEFKRGSQNSNNRGRYMYTSEQDRIISIQLFDKALALVQNQSISENSEVANFFLQYSQAIRFQRTHNNTWKLNELTDRNKLPDYKNNLEIHHNTSGAPVDADNNPIFYTIPDSMEKAKNDGELWQWLLSQASLNSTVKPNCLYSTANFYYEQFNIDTIRYHFRNRFRGNNLEQKEHTLAIHTLKENETIAKLASGIKRFNLPDKSNYIKIFQELGDFNNSNQELALNTLAQIFENRRQFDKAKLYWQRSIELNKGKWKQDRLNQITNNIGRFEPIGKQIPHSKTKFDFIFRNATEVNFTAQKINVRKLLTDIKKYLKSNPLNFDYKKINLQQIGQQLLFDSNEKKYLENKVENWQVALKPNPKHWDTRITIDSSIKKPGAYFITAKIKNGNTAKLVLWIEETAIIKKQIDKGVLYMIADSTTGEPIAGANLNFFGYKQNYIQYDNRNKLQKSKRRQNTVTSETNLTTNEYGHCIFKNPNTKINSWIISASTQKDNRFALYGIENIWFSQNHYDERNRDKVKIFTITDRPIYRPNQNVNIHAWLKRASYQNPNNSEFTNKDIYLGIKDPLHNTVTDTHIKTDKHGAIQFEFKIPENAKLGLYSLELIYSSNNMNTIRSYQNFKVEEYKKPEFEVKIIAPEKPIKLGDKFTAKIEAKYYFGSPVTNGTVKYKVISTRKNNIWYPPTPWDWLYDEGYWWANKTFAWHPTWRRWGCIILPPNYNRNINSEIIIDKTAELDSTGEIEIKIDTSTTKEIYGENDYEYKITAEVTDLSRRTIYSSGKVLAANKPFDIKVWTDRSYYNYTPNNTVEVFAQAKSPDGKPISADGTITVYKINYDSDSEKISENSIYTAPIKFDSNGKASHKIKSTNVGQYRIACTITKDSENIEGAIITTIRGSNLNDKDIKYNDLQLSLDKQTYKVGDEVNVLINSSRPNANIALFIRPKNQVYPKPIMLQLGDKNSPNGSTSKSKTYSFKITQADIPNIFVEAVTVFNGEVFTESAQIIIPPEKQIINLEIKPETKKINPSKKQKLNLKLTDTDGNPITGQVVITVYDKALEYISGPSSIPNIKEYFWKWTRHHTPSIIHNLIKVFRNIVPKGQPHMRGIGSFGSDLADDNLLLKNKRSSGILAIGLLRRGRSQKVRSLKEDSSMILTANAAMELEESSDGDSFGAAAPQQQAEAPQNKKAKIRKNFADLAYWSANIITDENGEATVEFPAPDDLTTWKIKAWAMGKDTKVGEGENQFTTSKNFIIRLQAPRFFVQNDEIVLSANVHNYLENEIASDVSLELEGNTLAIIDDKFLKQTINISSQGEKRIEWRVKANSPGNALIRMNALTNIESDAMQKDFPVYIHGIDKTQTQSGSMLQKETSAKITFNIPSERKPEQTKLEFHYTPSIATTIVNSIPYLATYKYECTEQTLNRFLPAVITQKFLERSGFELDQSKNSKLKDNPIFDESKLTNLIYEGVKRLEFMQNSDGGWGWFFGYQERSYPHTTATVVRGLLLAQNNDVKVPRNMLKNGINWLSNYQREELKKLNNWHIAKTKKNKKRFPSNVDAFVFNVLANIDIKYEKSDSKTLHEMEDYLYKLRNKLSLYSKSMLALAINLKNKNSNRVKMLTQNIEQFLAFDDENQTAFLKLGNNNYWWHWYGNDIESHAFYLKLLAATNPKSKQARGLVKYLVNNRKHVNYWNSTRDTALCIEALTDYLTATNEHETNLNLDISLDGKNIKTVNINKENLFSFDDKVIIKGKELTSGEHSITLEKKGNSPLFYNNYLSYFTLEKFITKAGLEIKVDRNYYKLTEVTEDSSTPDKKGQARKIKTKKYQRTKMANISDAKSGDLLEVELILTSKNDYEYIIVEDMKAAGTEPIDIQSGYTNYSEGIRAYREFRDERVAFFIQNLPRGIHSLTYKVKAETLGKFHALPTSISSMYAPELKGNSDENVINIKP